MAQSPDHPELAFVQASGYTRGRPDGPPLWIVIHDMEAHELSTTAENTAIYFATGAGGRSVSSHYTADDNSVVQCVLLRDTAWTVGNRPGNNRGINWELAGFARQTREEWLDAFGLAMFNQIAPIIRADAARYRIPLHRCTIADLRAYRPGVTSHNDLRLAFGVTDHTDPGPNFPWDYFMALLNGVSPAPTTVEDDMPYQLAVPNGTVYVVDGWNPYTNQPYLYPQTDWNRCLEWQAAGMRLVTVKQELTPAYWDVDGPDDVPITLTPEQMAALTAEVSIAAKEGAEAGAIEAADEIADAVVDEQHARLAE